MAPKDVHTLDPSACDYITLLGNSDLEDMRNNLEMKRFFLHYTGRSNVITRVLRTGNQ
jgi:hypothetical protein